MSRVGDVIAGDDGSIVVCPSGVEEIIIKRRNRLLRSRQERMKFFVLAVIFLALETETWASEYFTIAIKNYICLNCINIILLLKGHLN